MEKELTEITHQISPPKEEEAFPAKSGFGFSAKASLAGRAAEPFKVSEMSAAADVLGGTREGWGSSGGGGGGGGDLTPQQVAMLKKYKSKPKPFRGGLSGYSDGNSMFYGGTASLLQELEKRKRLAGMKKKRRKKGGKEAGRPFARAERGNRGGEEEVEDGAPMSPLDTSNMHKVRKAEVDVAVAYGDSGDWAARAMESVERGRKKQKARGKGRKGGRRGKNGGGGIYSQMSGLKDTCNRASEP